MCSRNHLNKEINLIKDDVAWNNFPKLIANLIIKRVLQTNDSNTIRSKKANKDSIKIFLNVNYSGKLLKEWSNHASRNCIKVLNEKLILNFSRTIKLQKSCFTGFESIIWSIKVHISWLQL